MYKIPPTLWATMGSLQNLEHSGLPKGVIDSALAGTQARINQFSKKWSASLYAAQPVFSYLSFVDGQVIFRKMLVSR